MANILELINPVVDGELITEAKIQVIVDKLNEVIQKVNGQSFDWQTYVNNASITSNAEFVAVYLDAEGKILYGERVDGTIVSPNISSDTTDKGYLGAEIAEAIDYMENNGRPQQYL